MAFISPIPEEEQNLTGAQGQTTPNPLALLPPQAGGSAGQGGGAPAGGGPNSGSPTQIGSGASRLSDYLAANAPQVAAEGQQIAGTLGSQFNQIGSDVGTLGTNFAQDVAAGYTPPDAGLTAQVAANPVAVAANPGQVSEFGSLLGDTYAGPASLESTTPFTNVQNEVTSAVQNAGLLNSSGGLSTYLQNNLEQNATPGETTLDTALLQANPGAIQDITGAASEFPGLTTNLSDVTTSSDALVPAAQQAAAAGQAGAQGALQTAEGNLNTNVQGELTAAEQAAAEYNPKAALLSSEIAGLQNPTQILEDALQVSGPGASIGDVTPTVQTLQQLLANAPQQVGAPTLAGAATPADFATASALGTLGAGPGTVALNPADAAEAGSYNVPTWGGDLSNRDQATMDALNYILNSNNGAGPGDQWLGKDVSNYLQYLQELTSGAAAPEPVLGIPSNAPGAQGAAGESNLQKAEQVGAIVDPVTLASSLGLSDIGTSAADFFKGLF